MVAERGGAAVPGDDARGPPAARERGMTSLPATDQCRLPADVNFERGEQALRAGSYQRVQGRGAASGVVGRPESDHRMTTGLVIYCC